MEAIGWAWREAAADRPTPRPGPAPARPGRARRTLHLLLAAATGGLAVLALGFFAFVAALERNEPPPPGGRADGIVALTGGAQRIGDAIDLLAAGHGRRLLITGVNARTGLDEIVGLNPNRRTWIECCVDLDHRARNTIGNAIETRRWMRRNGFGTVAVVTANYHMPRTLVEVGHALKEGEAVIPHPVVVQGFDVGAWWREPAVAQLLAAEYAKFLVAWVRTRFETDPEHSRFATLIGRGRPLKAASSLAGPH